MEVKRGNTVFKVMGYEETPDDSYMKKAFEFETKVKDDSIPRCTGGPKEVEDDIRKKRIVDLLQKLPGDAIEVELKGTTPFICDDFFGPPELKKVRVILEYEGSHDTLDSWEEDIKKYFNLGKNCNEN